MADRILIAFASRYGSTKGIAEAISRTLSGAGHDVDVRDVRTIDDLTPYRAIVIGSAVRGGQWLPEAVAFVRQHAAELRQVPVAYFAVGMAMQEPTEANRQTTAAALEAVRTVVPPVAEGLFAGALDPRTMPWPMRLMMRAMRAPVGDFRDWPAIDAWASALPERLGLTTTSA